MPDCISKKILGRYVTSVEVHVQKIDAGRLELFSRRGVRHARFFFAFVRVTMCTIAHKCRMSRRTLRIK